MARSIKDLKKLKRLSFDLGIHGVSGPDEGSNVSSYPPSLTTISGLTFPNASMGIGEDTNLVTSLGNKKVFVFINESGADSTVSGMPDQRYIEFDHLWKEEVTISLKAITGAGSSADYNGIQIAGTGVQLEKAENIDSLALYYQYEGEQTWHKGEELSNGTGPEDVKQSSGGSGDEYSSHTLSLSDSTGKAFKVRLGQENWHNYNYDHYAVRDLAIEGYSANSYVSGIISLPTRVLLRDSDQQSGMYPVNTRTGDRDSRKQASHPFDDTNTIDFLSPFPTAEISFQTEALLDTVGSFVDVTGSYGQQRYRINFTNDDLVIPSTDIPITLMATDDAGEVTGVQNSPKDLANLLVKKINEQSSTLGIRAFYRKDSHEKIDEHGNPRENPITIHTVVLRYDLPTISDNKPRINVGAVDLSEYSAGFVPKIPFKFKQFSSDRIGKVDYSQRLMLQQVGTLGVTHGSSHQPPSLYVSASLMPGISDINYRPQSEYTISPFNESRVNLKIGTSFEVTGTSPKILEGFSSPLRSKTQLVMEFNSHDENGNTKGKPIYWATGSSAESSGGPLGTYVPEITGLSGSGFAYWNDKDHRWEQLTLGEINHSDYQTITFNDPFIQPSSRVPRMLCGFAPHLSGTHDAADQNDIMGGFFSPNANSDHNLKLVDAMRGVGTPIKEYAFPWGLQYNATSSQEIRMSKYISSPFLLEKMTIEIDGIFGVGNNPMSSIYTPAYFPFRTKNLFLLNQFTSGDNPHVRGENNISQFYTHTTDGTPTRSEYSHPYKGDREIITWAKLGLTVQDSYITSSREGYSKLREDYDGIGFLDKNDYYSGNQPFFTGSFTFDITPKLPLASDIVSISHRRRFLNGNHTRPFALSNDLGGANLLGGASGRQIASSLGTAQETTTGSFIENVLENYRPKQSHFTVSPYLLHPTDKLILGWQNIDPYEKGYHTVGTHLQEQLAADELVDHVNSVKITMYGSLISGDKEYHDTLNQNLSTNQIHECIFGEPVIDQFDVESIKNLSGSIHDALFFGDMKVSSSNGNRGRRASIAKGEAGATGSLSRNIGLYNENTRFTDSIAPPIEFWLTQPQFFTGSSSSAGDGSGVSETVGVGGVARSVINLSSNPASSSLRLLRHVGMFNSRMFVARRTFSPASNFLETPGGGLATQANFLAFDNTQAGQVANYSVFSGTMDYVKGVNSFGSPEISAPRAFEPPTLLQSPIIKFNISKLFYAAPLISFGKITWPTIPLGLFGCIPLIRGFRYGFHNVTPTSPKTYFRRDKYGQFRDMLEQPPETATQGLVDLDTGEEIVGWSDNDSPIKVKFWSREVIKGGPPRITQTRSEDIDPSDTNTQNLSHFATSSMPYYDGLNKERDVANNPPPDMTDVTSIEEAIGVTTDGAAEG